MLGLILNKQEACTASDQTRLRVIDLCIKEAAYYLRLRIHVVKTRSGWSIPESGRNLKPGFALPFEELDCLFIRPFSWC